MNNLNTSLLRSNYATESQFCTLIQLHLTIMGINTNARKTSKKAPRLAKLTYETLPDDIIIPWVTKYSIPHVCC